MRNLTKNQRAVLHSLTGKGRALTAYEILDDVRDTGIRAPVQVYRALESLTARGAVHRIESMNAFVACAHGHGEIGDEDTAQTSGAGAKHHRATIAFAICDDCGLVSEIPAPKVEKTLGALAQDQGFVTDHAVLELRGLCGTCAAGQESSNISN